jgi:2-(3-amino-3-carboxypropyl)histidine synthase
VSLKSFDFEEERIKQEINKQNAKRVLLQLPEGLKPEAPRLAAVVENAGALAIISADPCYGACDVAVSEAERLGLDLVVHFGHAPMIKHSQVPTIYVEARATINIDNAVVQALPLLAGCERIGLATTVQHIQTLDRVREILVRAKKAVVIGEAGRLNYAGQVTGCDYSNVKSVANTVDAFIFVGGGRFHALGIAFSTSTPTVIADPYDGGAYLINAEAEKIIKQRWACIEKAGKSKTVGIIIGLKPGQRHLDEALKLKEAVVKLGKAAYLFAIKEVTPEALMEFPSVDVYVNTACPRISIEAPAKFSKPVLTENEFKVVSGELSWETLLKKGLFEN